MFFETNTGIEFLQKSYIKFKISDLMPSHAQLITQYR